VQLQIVKKGQEAYNFLQIDDWWNLFFVTEVHSGTVWPFLIEEILNSGET